MLIINQFGFNFVSMQSGIITEDQGTFENKISKAQPHSVLTRDIQAPVQYS